MLRYVLLIASLVTVGSFGNAPLRADQPTKTSDARPVIPNSGVSFTPNRGQLVDSRGERRPDVLYTASTPGTSVFVRAGAISYVFQKRERREHDDHAPHDEAGDPEAEFTVVEEYRMDLELVGARSIVQVLEEEPVPGLRNYYLAHCPDGITGVPSYRHLTLKNVYPNIDMVLRGTESGMKCDFIVNPGGRPSDIRMRYVGATSVHLTADGGVRAMTPLGELFESAPVSFQVVGGSQREVASHFRVAGNEVTFDLGRYDARRPLTIDPIRRWSTYYGGQNNELLLGGDPTEVDRGGNAIITGYVNANTFPATTGAHQTTSGGNDDAFVVKLNGSGALQWATYYGGSAADLAHGVVSDTAQNVFIAGHTFSNNFPVANAFQNAFAGIRDAFIVKFDRSGVRQWATYYGGARMDDGYGFAADSSGNVAVVITSQSSGLQTTGMVAKPSPAATGFGDDASRNDVLIAKFSSTGTRVWATYFGGSAEDFAYAVGSDTSQAIIISGWTYSTDMPVTNAAQGAYGGAGDAFVAKYTKDGARVWSTYYGGNARENDDNSGLGFVGVATDLPGNVFIGGVTAGSFPVTTGAAQATFGGGGRDGYVIKFSPTGTRLWATYFGGNGDDVGTGVASNPDGGILLTGFTASNNLPTTTNCIACGPQGLRDVFISRMSSLGVLEFVDYYGGTQNDEGHGISFDPYGSMVVAGNTWSTNFPIQNAAQAFKGGASTGNSDAFVVLFCDPSKPRIDSSGPLRFCPGDSVILQALEGYTEYRWNDLTANTTRTLVVRETGNYVLWARSVSGCEAYSDTIKVRVHTKTKPRISPAGPFRLCLPDSVTLDAGPGYVSYEWLPNRETTRSLKVRTSGTYRVMTIDPNGCRDTSEPVVVNASPRPQVPTITPGGPIEICEGDPLTLTAAGSSTDSYRWSNGQTGQSISPTTSGTYRVTVTTPEGCTLTSQDVMLTVNPKPLPVIYAQGPTTFCEGDSVQLSAAGGFAKYEWSNGATSMNTVIKQTMLVKLRVTDSKGCIGETEIQVTVVERPTPRLSVLGPTTFCEGGSVTLDAGDGYMSYRWSNGESTRTIEAKESGNYSVVVTSGVNCPGYSDTIAVTVNPSPRAELTGPIVVCQNSTATYSVATGASRKFTWTVMGTGAAIVSGANTESIVVQWGGAGNGSVRVRLLDESTGCTSDTVLTVTVGNSLVPSISHGATRICPGDSVKLDAGPGYASYLWSPGGETTRTIWVKAAGTYKVNVASAGGCTGSSADVVVTVAPTPTPVIESVRTPALCPGDTLTLFTGSYARYEWSNGDRGRATVIRDTGTYTVRVTDASGCQGVSQTFVVRANPIPRPTVSGPNSVCINTRATYCADGAANDQYTWTVSGAGSSIVSGQGTRCIEVQWGGSGVGRVDVSMISAETGCSGIGQPLSVSVASTLQPSITASSSTDLCVGDSVTLEAPSGYDTYAWSTGSTSRTLKVGSAGTYSVTVTGQGGCSGSGEITVTQRAPVTATVAADGPIEFCEGDSVRLSGPAGFASYVWSNGARTQSITVKASGAYALSVADEAGCTGDTDPVVVTVNPLPQVPTITRVGDVLISSPAEKYQWSVDGSIIPGATLREYRPTSTGQHTVRVSNAFGCSAVSAPADGAGASAVLTAPVISAVPGERVMIPITLKASRNLDAVSADEFVATLRFNKSLLFPSGTTPLGRIEGNERIIQIHGKRPAGMGSGDVATIEFIAALGDTSVSTLYLDSLVWLDASVQTTLEAGALTIVSSGGWRIYLPGGRLTISPPVPNPVVKGSAVIAFETIERGPTDVALYDVIGRRVLDISTGELPAGPHVREILTDPIPGGTYFIVLVTRTGRIVQPMQIAH